jgi:PadR family transcriptional regulator AphA
MSAGPKLSPTACVILGFLDANPRSGYEIKGAVDNSTRFFWAASYGQIYPELRRLREAGLVESERDDAGGRRRTRHRITAAGRRELRRWLAEPAQTFEMRDEWLLKLFFARSAGRAGTQTPAAEETAAALLDAKAAMHRETARGLREMESKVLALGNPHQLTVLRYGIALNEWAARYCDGAGDELPDLEEATG